MTESDDDALSYRSGYTTPPLSPTKSVATEGWLSPRTPTSPRKGRLWFRSVQDLDSDAKEPTLFSPISPFHSKSLTHLDTLCIPDLQPTIFSLESSNNTDSLAKHDRSPGRECSVSRTASVSPCPPRVRRIFDRTSSGSPPRIRSSASTVVRSSLEATPEVDDNVANDPHDPFTSPTINTIASDNNNSIVQLMPCTPKIPSPTKSLRPLLLREASSPVRSSQRPFLIDSSSSSRWKRSYTLDRFISHRPFSSSKERFELSQPAKRSKKERSRFRKNRVTDDTFRTRLQRSERLSNELRGLRESHSLSAARPHTYRSTLTSGHGGLQVHARHISTGAVWAVGGSAASSDTVAGVSTGQGGMLGSGTNAPLYTSAFLSQADPEAQLKEYERRVALALDVDQVGRVLQNSSIMLDGCGALTKASSFHAKYAWRDGKWLREGHTRLLDAPQLRDDYYCKLLAYSHTARCLAVGLGGFVHLWSEVQGVSTPESLNSVPHDAASDSQHVTSLEFSSLQGKQAVLAVGRADGRISLWSPFDTEPRFDATQPKPVSCVSWRPTTVQRPSLRDRAMDVATEELLVGDEVGHIYFYSVEWPSSLQSALFGWHGAMTLLACVKIHTQQICGLAWSPDGAFFASGGNDNTCFLLESKRLICSTADSESPASTLDVREGPDGESIYSVGNRSSLEINLGHMAARHRWDLNAAVKAIAFCPWQRGLIAIGGGSNDRCIHFYHTRSGACLATIDCAAQVTSLIWSLTKHEIAATFGFAQPEHPYRIAVFAWPSCEQVAAVPWFDENRALCAVAYPGGPRSRPSAAREGERESVNVEEGCIVVAASDSAIRFHEIWSDRRGSVGTERLMPAGGAGLLGGSEILEGLHGIESGGPVLR